MGFFGNLLKIGAPAVGFALGGPAGAMAGSAVAGAIGGAQDKAKAGKLSEQATALKLREYNQLDPVRQRAIQMALAPNPQRARLGSIFADAGNPYNKAGDAISQLRQPQPQQPPTGPPPLGPPARPRQQIGGGGGGGSELEPGLFNRLQGPRRY